MFHVELTPRAAGELDRLPKHVQRRIIRWLELLADDPRRARAVKLAGQAGLYRVHASKDYVIIYTIVQARLLVLVVRVANRKEAYRNL